MNNNRETAIELVQEAQEQLHEVIAKLQEALRQVPLPYYEHYIIAQLQVLASSEHGFLSSSKNLSDWAESLQNDEL